MNEKLQKYAFIAEILSALAIVVSLIFVGVVPWNSCTS